MTDFDRLAKSLRETYRLKSTVGTGGMAHVYAAEELKTGRQVAIKALSEERTTPVSVRRFLAEIDLTAQLNHPNIVPLCDSGSADGLPYYVMPFVEGQSLRERLVRLGRLPLGEALHICDQIGAALDYAHERRVVHRDIKPENVLLRSGRAMIFDFGIALPLDEIEPHQAQSASVLGTPAYMSPEQAQGVRPIDGRSDVYSLACMAYEMICGYPPLTASSPIEVLRRHISDIPLPLYCRLPGIPRELSAAVARGLAKRPADRFATPGALAAAMRAGAPSAGGDSSAAPAATGLPNGRGSVAHGIFSLADTIYCAADWARSRRASDIATLPHRLTVVTVP
jgi:serine/threonine-protein kinase